MIRSARYMIVPNDFSQSFNEKYNLYKISGTPLTMKLVETGLGLLYDGNIERLTF